MRHNLPADATELVAIWEQSKRYLEVKKPPVVSVHLTATLVMASPRPRGR